MSQTQKLPEGQILFTVMRDGRIVCGSRKIDEMNADAAILGSGSINSSFRNRGRIEIALVEHADSTVSVEIGGVCSRKATTKIKAFERFEPEQILATWPIDDKARAGDILTPHVSWRAACERAAAANQAIIGRCNISAAA